MWYCGANSPVFRCLSSGLGYDPGDQLGKVIPQFPAAAICHLISKSQPITSTKSNPTLAFILIVLGTCSHAYFLPRIHRIRDTRLSWIMWIVPGCCSFFLVICIIIDFALLAQLKNDKALEGPSVGSGNGVTASSTPGNATVNATNTTNVASGPNNATNPVSVFTSYTATGSVPVGIPPSSNPSGPPPGVPQKLSLRALSNNLSESIPPEAVVTAGGAFYL